MDDKKPTGDFHFKGKGYATEPGLMDRVKESFQTTDERAQLEAIRRARQSAFANGVASSK